MKYNLKSVTVCWEPVVEEVESESCESRWQLVVTVYLLTELYTFSLFIENYEATNCNWEKREHGNF